MELLPKSRPPLVAGYKAVADKLSSSLPEIPKVITPSVSLEIVSLFCSEISVVTPVEPMLIAVVMLSVPVPI